MQISEHFTLEELTRTSTGLENDPPFEVAGCLTRLAEDLLEPICSLLFVPIYINSGYRSPAVNQAVGGDPKSAHMEGRAADLRPLLPEGYPLRKSFDSIRLSNLPFDKLIFEERNGIYWIHAQIPRKGMGCRRKAYIASVTDTGTAYREVPVA